MLSGESGYTFCLCCDCMEITISSGVQAPELCAECQQAGCEGGKECSAPEAYGAAEVPDVSQQ